MDTGSLFGSMLAERDCHPRVFAYYFKEWNGFHMAFHSHNSTEIMYVMNGVCRVDIRNEDGAEESVALKKGEFIILDANVTHRLMVEPGIPCRMLNVEFGFASGTCNSRLPSIKDLASQDESLSRFLSLPFRYTVMKDPDELYHVLKSLVLELSGEESGSGAMVHLLFSQLIIRIARLRKASDASGLQHSDYYVKRSIDYLHQNYDRDIQVKDIAASVNLHPGYLHRIFKAHTGRTITAYLTALRMEKAKMLLLQTDIPVIDISDYVGIGSRQYFHMLFKKYVGCTPVDFRRSIAAEKFDYPSEQASDDI